MFGRSVDGPVVVDVPRVVFVRMATRGCVVAAVQGARVVGDTVQVVSG